jgi:hypothetical protein
MLTPDEKDYLNKIPTDKFVKIYPYNPKVMEVAKELIDSIKKIYPDLEVKHMGAIY